LLVAGPGFRLVFDDVIAKRLDLDFSTTQFYDIRCFRPLTEIPSYQAVERSRYDQLVASVPFFGM
jgi:hypothetical protein